MKTLSHAELRKVKAALPDLYKFIREQQVWIRHWSGILHSTRAVVTPDKVVICNTCGNAFQGNPKVACGRINCPWRNDAKN